MLLFVILQEYLKKIVTGEILNKDRDLVLANQCVGSKANALKALQYSALGQSHCHYNSTEV